MTGLLVASIPAFFLLMLAELLSYRHLAQEAREELAGYELRDTRTSLLMGTGNVVIAGVWNIVALVVFAALYSLSPLRIAMDTAWSWVLLLVVFDFFYYIEHRAHHRIRAGWASHVVHHSSQHFNLSTALRQPWTPMSSTFFFAPVSLLGFPPAALALMIAISMLYQFWIHTERIDRLPRPLEAILNTPAHHRVHHGSDADYLDRNYGGILIIWDRMFGTFIDETARPTYGLTTNVDSFNPLRVAFHEWAAIGHDVRTARRWRDRLGYLFGPPGWSPKTTAAPATATPAAPAGDPRPVQAPAPPPAVDRLTAPRS